METPFTQPTQLVLEVPPEKAGFFSLILQSGILMSVPGGMTIGEFLEGLPGFSVGYIIEEVQTIFLNGTATDDLNTPFNGSEATLAISAAMPGLAGAIFRKNSLHAALRTKSGIATAADNHASVNVTLKLFNAIARDRGGILLQEGVVMRSESVLTFFSSRPSLLECITSVTSNNRKVSTEDLYSLLAETETVFLSIAA